VTPVLGRHVRGEEFRGAFRTGDDLFPAQTTFEVLVSEDDIGLAARKVACEVQGETRGGKPAGTGKEHERGVEERQRHGASAGLEEEATSDPRRE
jgi:hypothetical protein